MTSSSDSFYWCMIAISLMQDLTRKKNERDIFYTMYMSGGALKYVLYKYVVFQMNIWSIENFFNIFVITFGWVQQQRNSKPTQKWWQKCSRNVQLIRGNTTYEIWTLDFCVGVHFIIFKLTFLSPYLNNILIGFGVYSGMWSTFVKGLKHVSQLWQD